MSGDQEFWRPVVERIIDAVAPAAPMLISKLITPKTPPPAQPGQQALPQSPQSQGQPPQPENTPAQQPAATDQQPAAFDRKLAFEFLKLHAKPFLQWFKDGQPGEAFAQHLFDLYGAEWNGLPWLAAKSREGIEGFVSKFKGSPWWFEIADAEDRFREYVTAFVEWKPAAADTIIDIGEVEESN